MRINQSKIEAAVVCYQMQHEDEHDTRLDYHEALSLMLVEYIENDRDFHNEVKDAMVMFHESDLRTDSEEFEHEMLMNIPAEMRNFI